MTTEPNTDFPEGTPMETLGAPTNVVAFDPAKKKADHADLCKSQTCNGYVFSTPGIGNAGDDMTLKEASSLTAISDENDHLWEANLLYVVCLGCGGMKWHHKAAGGVFYKDPEADLAREKVVRDPSFIIHGKG